MAPESVGWLVEGLLALKVITELDAKLKAGKTLLILAMIKAMQEGRPFLGFPTRKVKVIYLTEERSPSFIEALEITGLKESDDLVVLSRLEAMGVPWPGMVTLAREEAGDRGADLIVVDTWANGPA
jgi:hypothetical protein